MPLRLTSSILMRCVAAAGALALAACASGTALQTARSAPPGVLKVHQGTELVRGPHVRTPDGSEISPHTRQDESFTRLIVDGGVALGLPLGLEVQGSLMLIGAAAGAKWQLVGDQTSPVALALLGHLSASVFEGSGTMLYNVQRQVDVLGTVGLTERVDLTVAGRAIATETTRNAVDPARADGLLEGPYVDFVGLAHEFGGGVGLEWGGSPRWRAEVSVLRWLPVSGLSRSEPGWTVSVAFAWVRASRMWGSGSAASE